MIRASQGNVHTRGDATAGRAFAHDELAVGSRVDAFFEACGEWVRATVTGMHHRYVSAPAS